MRGPAATGWLRVSGLVTVPVGGLTGVLHAGSHGDTGCRPGRSYGSPCTSSYPPPPPPHAGLGTMPPVSALAGIPQIEGVQEEGPRGPPTSEAISHGPSVTSMLANLLPLANSSLQQPSEGVYMGDGIPPVPAKLAARIRKGEFVEMGELLPEFWAGPKDEESDFRRELKTRRSRKVVDIHTWVQCFSSYVATRAPQAPHLIPELMAYLATIVRVSQDYAGLAWVRYDAAFRRQATLTKNMRWSVINSTLYTMCFTGMAAATKRCELCFATSHTDRECAQRGDPDPDMGDRLKIIESAVLALTGGQQGKQKSDPPAAKPSGEFCRKWNSGGCSYPRCRHSHSCSNCQGNHPAVKCSARRFSSPAGQPSFSPNSGAKIHPY